jgi:hypothetical protein
MRRFLVAGLLVVAASGLASAAPKGKNVGDAEKWRESEDLLKRNEKSASGACGTELPITYDVPSFGDLSLDDAKPLQRRPPSDPSSGGHLIHRAAT